ncbi:ASCH domain-containing protein [Candidatus Chloroploca sp. M-50]|uniref:ASCH domain-containing protein n=1 Tax=Candidatus Chloroploca mongolica TaxID=2528176 RepID=A0ABS4DD56_9CHLR|nr:ASCH domain-containing protein [Candidatus Chloroploca mongolica]MBP1467380.1 ASCH domain-containing protein [Candidatus Chloroploca mongolica]
MQPLPSIETLIARLAVHGIKLPQGPVRVDGYGNTAELSTELLNLIKSGRKRAGTGLLWAYEHDREPIAATGDIEIVVDHRNQPALITRIVTSEIVAFNEVNAEYAAIEGEGDGSLEYWRKGHWNFFSRECRRIGREPTETMPVICNVFEVLHVLPLPSEA